MQKNLFGIDWEGRWYLSDENRTDYIYEMAGKDLAIKRDCPSNYSWGWNFKGEKIISNHTIKAGVEGNYLGYGGADYKYVDTSCVRGNFTDSGDEHELSKVNSAFIQNRWSLLSSLDIYLGIRVDDYEADSDDCEKADDTPVSPKFGLFYKPLPFHSVR